MTDRTLRADLQNLFRAQQLAVLSTFGDGQPYCSLVAFAATEDLDGILFATTRSTRKYANLRAEPRVSLLIDDRSNLATDFHAACAVTVTGEAAEVDGPERSDLLQLYLGKHPYLEDFVTAPSCALLRVAVDRYYRVQHFQEVEVLRLAPWAS